MKLIFLFLLLATVARGATYDYPVKTPMNPPTANRAATTDANGKLVVSTVTTNELGYVSGVTSAIQTQLNAKGAATNGTFIGGTFTGTTNTGGIFTGTLTGTNAALTTPRLTGTTTNTLGNFQVANQYGFFGVSTGGVAEALISITSANGVGIASPTESGNIYLQPRHASGTISLVNSAGLTGLSMAGSSVITVSSNLIANAKLGIGVTPTSLLHIYGSGGVQQLLHSTTTTGPIIQLNGQRTDNAGFMVIGQLASYPSASYQNGDNSMRMLVTSANEGGMTTAQTWKSDGKTGIGTITPQYTLDVIGQARLSGTNGINFGGTSGAADHTVTLYQVSSGRLLNSGALENVGNMNVGFYGAGSVANLHVKGAGLTGALAVFGTTGNSPTNDLLQIQRNGTNLWSVDSNFTINQAGTITTAGTTGAQTINKPIGSVNLAAAATSLVVTCSAVGTSANTVVMLTVGSNDTTCKSCAVVVGTGQFTIYPNAAPTAETVVFFQVLKIK